MAVCCGYCSVCCESVALICLISETLIGQEPGRKYSIGRISREENSGKRKAETGDAASHRHEKQDVKIPVSHEPRGKV